MFVRLNNPIFFTNVSKYIWQAHGILIDDVAVGCGESLILTFFRLFVAILILVIVNVAYDCDVILEAFNFRNWLGHCYDLSVCFLLWSILWLAFKDMLTFTIVFMDDRSMAKFASNVNLAIAPHYNTLLMWKPDHGVIVTYFFYYLFVLPEDTIDFERGCMSLHKIEKHDFIFIEGVF